MPFYIQKFPIYISSSDLPNSRFISYYHLTFDSIAWVSDISNTTCIKQLLMPLPPPSVTLAYYLGGIHTHIQSVRKSCSLPVSTLVRATVISHLDFLSSSLIDLPVSTLSSVYSQYRSQSDTFFLF